MSSESERRLSTEELKRLNRPQAMQMPPTPPDTPTRQDWNDLLAALTALYWLESTNSDRLDGLEASVAAQEALLRALSQQMGQLPHPGAGGGPGAGCGPNTGGTETGWEEERAFYLAAQSPDRAVGLDLAGPDPVGGHGWHGGLADDLVRLGRTLEGNPDAVSVRDATTMHQHTDRKTLRRERAKKIAMGHKPDDHEDEIDMTMKGY